jgi:hypothetical protein
MSFKIFAPQIVQGHILHTYAGAHLLIQNLPIDFLQLVIYHSSNIHFQTQ